MRRVFHLFLIIFLTIIQIAFLSHLPTPFSDISFPLLGITLATFIDKPLRGALWALLGGILLDIHGIFPFGAEIVALLSIFYLTRLLFRRFITNASLPAAFLLSTVIITMHRGLLLLLDGIRVIFGSEPFIITQDASVAYALLRMIIVNGLLTVALLAGWRMVKKRFAYQFIIRQ